MRIADWVLYVAVGLTGWSLVVLGQSVEAVAQAAKVSDPVLLAIVGGVVTIVTTVFGGIMTYFLAKIQRQGQAAAVKVEEVVRKTEEAAVERKQVKEKVEEVAKKIKADSVKAAEEVKQTLASNTETANTKLDAIHTLVNSAMGVQLKINAVTLRKFAAITNLPEDAIAAEEAEKKVHEHEAKQSIVDNAEKQEEKK